MLACSSNAVVQKLNRMTRLTRRLALLHVPRPSVRLAVSLSLTRRVHGYYEIIVCGLPSRSRRHWDPALRALRAAINTCSEWLGNCCCCCSCCCCCCSCSSYCCCCCICNQKPQPNCNLPLPPLLTANATRSHSLALALFLTVSISISVCCCCHSSSSFPLQAVKNFKLFNGD